jgi:hypothetical protein
VIRVKFLGGPMDGQTRTLGGSLLPSHIHTGNGDLSEVYEPMDGPRYRISGDGEDGYLFVHTGQSGLERTARAGQVYSGR